MLFFFACSFLILLKHMIASQLPIEARPGYRTDDLLMVMMTRNILRGKWLGAYGYGTLMKGCLYPLFLSATYLSGLSYLRVLDILNSVAALYFTLQVRPILRRRRWLLVLFAVLLFNPVTSATLTFQRVYRCSISSMQTLFLFGAVAGMYLREQDRGRRRVFRAVFCGIVLWSVWNTREDAVWVLPFVIAAGVVILVRDLRTRKNRSGRICAVVVFLMPFLLLLGGNAAIAAINQHYYGLPIRNEASAGFGKMLKTMYSIKNQEDHRYVSITAEKLERMYAVSPTLRKIEAELNLSLKQADIGSDRIQGDGEVEDGWFFWCIRRALENTGVAPTLTEANAFYLQVNQELETAIRDPDSPFETQWVMPSALMSPWRDAYWGEIFRFAVDAAEYMITYNEVSAVPRTQKPEEARMTSLFEGITGDAAIYDGTHLSDYRQLFIQRADTVASVYRAVNPAAAILCMALYLGQFAAALIRRAKKEIPWLLTVTGIGLSIVVLLAGIAYTEMTAFIAIRYTYISGGYALMLAFEWIVILRFAETLCGWLKNRRWLHARRKNRTDHSDALPE